MSPGNEESVGRAGGFGVSRLDAVRRAVATTRRRNESLELAAVGVWGLACTVAHFVSMYYSLYAQYYWWDTTVHAASGLGVAAVVFVLRPRTFRHPLALLLAIPAIVFAIGAWFEVYERLFTTFWIPWPTWFYLQDTAIDLVANTTGAFAFGVVRYGVVRTKGAEEGSLEAVRRERRQESRGRFRR